MTYQVTVVGKPVLDIYECDNGRCWFVTKKTRKAGQDFLSGYVRCFRPSMLAEFHHLPEEVLNDPKQSMRRVPKEAWPRCPCVDVKDVGADEKIVRCNDRGTDARPYTSYSDNCKEVDEKMETDTQQRVNGYLALFDMISEKADSDAVAIAILQEISKDRRSGEIRTERAAQSTEPATEKQRQFMKKLNIRFPANVTKQEASALIDEELAKNGE